MKDIVRAPTVFLLLFAVLQGYAAWDTDPQNPTYHWGDLREGHMVTDGFGGAFFCVGSYAFPSWQRVGHINADGEFTFAGTPPEWPGLLLATESDYGTHGTGLRMVASEPPGTVIACDRRIRMDGTIAGNFFTKFDTLGFTGFERIVFDDPDYRLIGGVESDGQGGIHFILMQTIEPPWPQFYNHLSASGELSHDWPGLPLSGRMSPDGYGGIFLTYRIYPNTGTWGIRFDQNGIQQWEENRLLCRDGVEVAWEYLLEPGHLLLPGDSLLTSDEFWHYVHLVDTAGNQLWGEQGIRIAEEYLGSLSGYTRFVPDELGGFFNNRYTAPGPSEVYRYNENGTVIASNQSGGWIDIADGEGGGYKWISHSSSFDSISISFNRFNPDLTLSWPDSTLAVDVQYGNWGENFIAAENNGLIGIVHSSPGVIFYHINPDGSLGPRLDSETISRPQVSEFQIISAYPNPFNSITNLLIELPGAGRTTVDIYNVRGQLIERLYSGMMSEGAHRILFDAEDLPSGIYFANVAGDLNHVTKKLVLIK
ncbi:T9SS type A sorting domain-containing protein [bacterium]|nr:T9SS type A sorting domain-containing protein [bacterium]